MFTYSLSPALPLLSRKRTWAMPTPAMPLNLTILGNFPFVPIIEASMNDVTAPLKNVADKLKENGLTAKVIIPFDTQEIMNELYDAVGELRKFVDIGKVEIDLTKSVEGERFSVKAPEGVWLRPVNMKLHEKTFEVTREVLARIDRERPTYDWIVEEAKKRAEKLSNSMADDEVAYHLIMYDVYSDSFAEYHFVHKLEFVLMKDDSIERRANVEDAKRVIESELKDRPKVYAELIVLDPFEIVTMYGGEGGELEEYAEELASSTETIIEVTEAARKYLNGHGNFTGELLREVPYGVEAMNPYLSAALHLSGARANNEDPHLTKYATGTGVPILSVTLPPSLIGKKVAGLRYKPKRIQVQYEMYEEELTLRPVIGVKLYPLY